MTITSHTISIELAFTDTIGSHLIAIDLVCTDDKTFSSPYTPLPESAFSTEMKEAYNLAMRELSGHYPQFTFLSI